MRWLLLLGVVFAVMPCQGDLIRGPYVQLAREDGITVVWRSDRAMSEPVLRYGVIGGSLDQVCRGEAILRRKPGASGSLASKLRGMVQYEAKIDGLLPGMVYRYAVCDGEEPAVADAESLFFKTHPVRAEATSARIWVVGDSGTGNAHQRKVHDAMKRFVRDDGRELDLYLHVGDMAYGSGTDGEFQERFFEPYAETLKQTVCWASMGNHEGKSSNGYTGVGPYYDAYVCPTKGEAGGVASGKESYYSFEFGDIHFICLNSHDLERRPEGEMAKWLVRDLAAVEARWIVAFWHHPPYSKGTHDSDAEVQMVEMREHMMPILEDGGVDLVLSGHSHIYERSMLIDGAYGTPTTLDGVILDDGDGDPEGDGAYRKSGKVVPHEGTVAVVTGHGGALGRQAMGVMPIMRRIVMDHGSMVIDVDGDTLSGVMLDLRGKVRDRFGIVKSGERKRVVIRDPWRPDQETIERTGDGVVGSAATRVAARKAQVFGERNPALLLPKGVREVIPRNAEWDYLAGGEAPETEMWTKLGFEAEEEGWRKGNAGFGYGDDDDRTELRDMKDRYGRIFIRREFEIPEGTDLQRLGLAINYDDGFVLYVNGRSLLSKSVEPQGDGGPPKVRGHEAGLVEYFPLKAFAGVFREGRNVIALEGHNVSLGSTDLTLDPWLVVEE